ncbi:type II toxin-antitoxin system RelE family toxin [Estrella lausannensis]|uniref:Addiction module toxin, RelE family n=1 Tax=Estrella lausannensis TaxID=483423 RepID=A0A0H5DSC6_9BACT|nr:type II toxin-antitoxin system RelE/ParE family toxin [Estrella lausannensis]CRX39587.1 addiction module toxin, RelE family [Estrella lausannensis]
MTNKYNILFNKNYIKDLEKIPKKDREYIRESVLSLAKNPRPDGCKKLKGSKDPLYRIRCGDYRVVYEIRDNTLVILVIDVGHRKDIYRD